MIIISHKKDYKKRASMTTNPKHEKWCGWKDPKISSIGYQCDCMDAKGNKLKILPVEKPKQAHTPTPYEIEFYKITPDDKLHFLRIVRGKKVIAEIGPKNEENLSIASLVVRACNSHEELLKALKHANNLLKTFGSGDFAIITNAIANAEEK